MRSKTTDLQTFQIKNELRIVMDPCVVFLCMENKYNEFKDMCLHRVNAQTVFSFVDNILSHEDFGRADMFQNECGKRLYRVFIHLASDLCRFDVVTNLLRIAESKSFGSIGLYSYLMLSKNVKGIEWFHDCYKRRKPKFKYLIEYAQISYSSEMGCFLMSKTKKPETAEIYNLFCGAVNRRKSFMVLKRFTQEYTPKSYTNYIRALVDYFNTIFNRIPIPLDLIKLMKSYV